MLPENSDSNRGWTLTRPPPETSHLNDETGSDETGSEGTGSDEMGSEGTGSDESRSRAELNARLALLVFVAVEVAALITILVLGRHMWFTSDEWDFLADRKANSIVDLFRPHNGHWSTLPILAYQGLFHVFGLKTYFPYQLVLVLLDLTAAALLRTIMRRAGVSPWIATAAASLFVLFGAGYQNMIWAFQIGFVGALVFGLTHLLLADHDGPVSRRDYLGLLAGVAGLMCSGIAIPMTVAVGLAMWLRRGWRVALLHTVPLAVIYAVWWFGIGRTYSPGPRVQGGLSGLARWVEVGIRSSFEAMGQLTGVGIALGALLVVGLWVAWSRADRKELGIRAAAPGALLIGGVVFFVISGTGVDAVLGPGYASTPRYIQIFTAMTLPAIAVAADALVRRWRFFMPVALVLLVIGIPGNLWDLGHPNPFFGSTLQPEYRSFIVTLASVPAAHEVPRSTLIEDLTSRFLSPPPPTIDVTLGWLLDQKAAGRLPNPPLDPQVNADDTLAITIKQSQGPTGSPTIGGTIAPSPSTPGGQSTTGTSGVSTPLVRIADSPKDGHILVDGNGATLYTLTNGNEPVPCSGECGTIWHPLPAPAGDAVPTGGPGVSGLGKSSSGDVVTYLGFPLFSYSGDTAPGKTSGDGIRSFGGTWHVIKLEAAKACNALVSPETQVLEKGESISFTGGGLAVIYGNSRVQSDELIFEPTKGHYLTILAPLKVQLLPVGSNTIVCTGK